ncbi:hypothetical protein EDB89DRAFT_1848271 [Lactarius sanguifluus]|nr:hypothetical protein EDB89DRAFT_1848271 [Lactarius sanguifluus]
MYSHDDNPAVRHNVYFFPDGDIVIRVCHPSLSLKGLIPSPQVGDSVFRIHRFFSTRESKHFRAMFITNVPCRDPPGSSESNPVVLKDATSEAFVDFLWIFYNNEYSIYNATLEKWKRILGLAQQWGFLQVEKLCVRELQKMSIPSIEKIKIYQDFNIDPDLLYDSYVDLIKRSEPLNLEEGMKLELLTSLKIARARELARTPGPDGTTGLFGSATIQLQESEIQSVIKDVFGLQGPAPPPVMQCLD